MGRHSSSSEGSSDDYYYNRKRKSSKRSRSRRSRSSSSRSRGTSTDASSSRSSSDLSHKHSNSKYKSSSKYKHKSSSRKDSRSYSSSRYHRSSSYSKRNKDKRRSRSRSRSRSTSRSRYSKSKSSSSSNTNELDANKFLQFSSTSSSSQNQNKKIYYLNKININELLLIDKCPLCYGLDDFNTILIENETINSKQFMCLSNNVTLFINHFVNDDNNMNTRDRLINLWYTLEMNPEPLILQLFNKNDGYPVPKYYGACGRYIIVEDCGIKLHDYLNTYLINMNSIDGWLTRAYIALQLLQSMKLFTSTHNLYHLYLLDISSDNIVIDIHTKRIKFIDFEHIILKQYNNDNDNTDLMEHVYNEKDFIDDAAHDNLFKFSKLDICMYDISDINYYAICKIILSPKAPYPMIEGGLLYSMPPILFDEYPNTFKLIDECIHLNNNNNNKQQQRYHIINKLINLLEKILYNEQFNYN
ncbi:uncharacterized protein LOC123293108 [Chrysoperla carnea]|uniref:uncharacterized protein LOC123293108 n=1 Tax=Chrysoperla carnea TaxID=189513 RepID=UPI001D089D07|nr:uncharacterized protein LOC123293108 [Chrysoperla carnea]